ncbi:hypothetical protein H0H81_004763 [Sphagnurus paluster]|uniref:Cytochrome P450 n=1 Tax=Sphagnurus paluster TaxID=117069 RepID=A0A9P7FUK1_9AGAR|nr:hypothetical protein H0H81_004763 [Sphagnurus paluster]
MITQTLLVATTFFTTLYIFHRLRNKQKLPPGPPGWPLIGNLLDMPRETTWKTFTEWGQKYGPISSATVFGQPIIILNSADVALAMLSGKSEIYSDRPTLPMAGELVGWKNTMPLVRYGDTSRKYRKLFHQLFGTHAAAQVFHDFEKASLRKFLQNVLETPGDFVPHLKTHIGTVTLGMVYGYDVGGRRDDPFMHLLDHGMEQFAVVTAPGGFLVDLLPSR